MTMPLLLVLIGCAGAKSDPVVTVAPEITRPACRPAAGLMVPPSPLPTIKPGDRMVDVSARDTMAFNALRRAMISLQDFVKGECQ